MYCLWNALKYLINSIKILLINQNTQVKGRTRSDQEVYRIFPVLDFLLKQCYLYCFYYEYIILFRFGEYYDYGDVCFNLLSVLSKLLAKAGKKEKGSPVYVDNVLNFLESFPLPGLYGFHYLIHKKIGSLKKNW